MPIPPLPLFKHRDTVVTPADQNQFVTQFENTMDTMSNDVIPAMNLAITDINENVITATTARDESEDARDIAVAAKDEALTAVATLQEGAIDDITIALNKAFSNQYVQNNYYDKDEVDSKTFTINTLPDKPTPVDTDNLAIQETGGLLKKLSFSNLKNTLLNYFGVKISSDGFSIKNAIGGTIKNQCTAWAKVDGTQTPPVILDSFNFNAVTRVSTGFFKLNYNNANDNNNISISGLSTGTSNFLSLESSTINDVTVSISNYAGTFGNRMFTIMVFGGKN